MRVRGALACFLGGRPHVGAQGRIAQDVAAVDQHNGDEEI